MGRGICVPQVQGDELAKVVNEPVLATPIELPAPVETLKTAPVIAVKPTGEEVAVAEVVEAPPAEVATLENAARLTYNSQSLVTCGIDWATVTRRVHGSFVSFEANCLSENVRGFLDPPLIA